MGKLDKIKLEVATLSEAEQAQLREWLIELDEQRFDDQIERDEASGKLDRLAEKARENLRTGRVRDL